ncbi:hypothetical protein XI00_13610 [Bradyrhizobium sp. CCBAU 21359]|uniref:hypothetical protein n=1 Tax=Bradyrhizobium sp. CCBAU 21359 TaxID=1325080 RepID=UPI0023057E86|nr:hypothetical protein [Bradyrhizobium sp. CCBAU 21359]MDA9455252.1 hypothetical protein [Bradyrhizobium sp. CCBAU 21359]
MTIPYCPDYGGPVIDLSCSALNYATCGELVGEMTTRCLDEAPIVSVTSAAGTLEHVIQILVMRPRCSALTLFTESGNVDNATVF